MFFDFVSRRNCYIHHKIKFLVWHWKNLKTDITFYNCSCCHYLFYDIFLRHFFSKISLAKFLYSFFKLSRVSTPSEVPHWSSCLFQDSWYRYYLHIAKYLCQGAVGRYTAQRTIPGCKHQPSGPKGFILVNAITTILYGDKFRAPEVEYMLALLTSAYEVFFLCEEKKH